MAFPSDESITHEESMAFNSGRLIGMALAHEKLVTSGEFPAASYVAEMIEDMYEGISVSYGDVRQTLLIGPDGKEYKITSKGRA